MKLKGTRIFINWLFTILIGSALAPMVIYLFVALTDGVGTISSREFGGMYFLVAGISFVISGLISLPSLIIWLVTLAVIKSKNTQKQVLNKMHLTHFVTYLLTIGVAGIIIFLLEGRRDMFTTYPMFALIVTYYMLIGVSVWVVRMRKIYKLSKSETAESADVLDILN